MASSDDADFESRARIVDVTDVEARVQFIEGEMEALAWERGKSAKRLAAIWGIGLGSVQTNSAEASRRVLGEVSEAKREIATGARKLLLEAVDAHDPNGFAQVARVWADVIGAKEAAKHELTGKDGAPLGPVIYVPPESDD
jgi:hypothetical protein